MIAIGALGGSGTRAIAEIFIRSGLYMGDDLNEAYDNLIFTRLFKNPNWYKKSSISQKQKRMTLFEKYMRTNRLSIKEINELNFAARTNPNIHSNQKFFNKITEKLSSEEKNLMNWGWKEPNTQIYFEELMEYFDKLKYIHILRHGLDMAFSKNKQQLHNWGWKFDIIINGDENEEELAYKQLKYWIESTKDILNKSKRFQDRFLLINHSQFCNNPNEEIDRLLEFADLEVSKEIREELYKIPKNTGSNNRYKDKDLNIFEESQIDFVQKMGFEI